MSSESASNRTRTPAERRLVAVVHADMVGYSRLIGLDDVGTLERLRTLRRDLIDPAIARAWRPDCQDRRRFAADGVRQHRRRGALCGEGAAAVPEPTTARRPPEARIRFRVGINIGDVIADGSDLHGEGVNVAARLQAECPPGGICVSRAVRDHVHGRLDLAFEDARGRSI